MVLSKTLSLVCASCIGCENVICFTRSTVEFDFRQTPYVVSSKEQVQLATISGSSLTLGPVVVKQLPVGNSQPGGRWCNRNNGGCCNFSLSSTMSTTDCLLNTSCGGGMEGWRLLCSLECENGLLSFSLFKDSVSRGDSGDYVFTFGNDINNLAINGDNLTTTNVDVKLPTVAVVVISVTVPLVVVVIVLVVVAVVGCGVRLLKRGDQERAGLADELHAEPGENDRLVQVPGGWEWVCVCVYVCVCVGEKVYVHKCIMCA